MLIDRASIKRQNSSASSSLLRVTLFKRLPIASLISLFLLPVALNADTEESAGPVIRRPQIVSVFPAAAQPGRRAVVEATGEFLDQTTQVRFETDDLQGEVLSSAF